jgi:hypothetical protein
MRKSFLLCLAFLMTGFTLFAAPGESVKISRLPQPIEFDGKPFEAAWGGLEFFPMTQNRPNFGNAPTETTEVIIAYDNEFVWIAARLYMTDASKIVDNTKKRDAETWGTDCFGILLDSYNDNENALAFFTTPSGLRTDYAVSNDGVSAGGQGPPGMGAMNFSWNTFWDVKTSRDDKGWYLEMRIPFSSIRFKSQNDIATMGVLISRSISFNNETDTWPTIDPKYGFMATNKPSLAGKVEIEGARPKKPVYISPYVIGGFSRDWQVNEAETAYEKDDNPEFNAGLDVKYSLSSNLTLDLTANTDFAQVEADDQQVNLTRYSLFFPEKRAFFQERSSLFSFGLGDMSDLFYSRNIGISAEGDPIRIYGGARLTGRVGKWDLGLLDMQTAEHGDVTGENFGLLRVRRSVINPNSFVGGIFTSRLGMDGAQNFAYGMDGIFRVFGDDYLSLKAAQTYDSKIGNSIGSIDPAFFMVGWERRSEEGFAYEGQYTYTGSEFNPGIGFVQRAGVQGAQGGLMYGWLPGEQSKWFSIVAELRGDYYSRIDDGKLESMRVASQLEFESKKQIGGELSLEYQREGVVGDFPLSDSIWIKAGDYSFVTGGIEFRTPESRKLSVFVMAEAGGFFDGNKIGIMAGPNLNLSSSLQLSARYEFNALRFPDRDVNNSLDIHSVNVKALYMLSTKLSASILLQYVNTEDDLIANFRLRYNPREGNDFYLVINEYRGVEYRMEYPAHPPYYNRTIMLKYTHTFRL